MPAKALESLAKKAGVSLEKAEQYWDDAKKAAEEKGLKDDRMYAYAMGIVKRRLGLSEESTIYDYKELIIARLEMNGKKFEAAGISPIVFHSLSHKNFENMLQSNKIYLTPVAAKDAEGLIDTKKLYFLSTARTRVNKFFEGDAYAVILTLDGRALSHKYSGDPIDYWGPDFRKHANYQYEQEDRIYSNDTTIPNASNYIKCIDVYIERLPKNRSYLLKLLKFGKVNDIPVRFFKERKDFVIGNKTKVIEGMDVLKNIETAPNKKFDSSVFEFGPMKSNAADSYEYRELEEWLALTEAMVSFASDNLAKQIRMPIIKRIDRLRNASRVMQLYRTVNRHGSTVPLKNTMHNLISKRTSVSQKLVDKLARVMKYYRLRTYRDYKEFLFDIDQYGEALERVARLERMPKKDQERFYRDEDEYQSDVKRAKEIFAKRRSILIKKYKLRMR